MTGLCRDGLPRFGFHLPERCRKSVGTGLLASPSFDGGLEEWRESARAQPLPLRDPRGLLSNRGG